MERRKRGSFTPEFREGVQRRCQRTRSCRADTRDAQPQGWDEEVAIPVAVDTNPAESIVEVELEARVAQLERMLVWGLVTWIGSTQAAASSMPQCPGAVPLPPSPSAFDFSPGTAGGGPTTRRER
jgi:hypothetical protein